MRKKRFEEFALLLCLLSLGGCSFFSAADLAKAGPAESCETAIPVVSVSEEYRWVKKNIPGARVIRQSLINCPGFPADRLIIEQPDGSEKPLFFNLSTLMEGKSPGLAAAP